MKFISGVWDLHDDEVPGPASVIRLADREDEKRLTGYEIFATKAGLSAARAAQFSGELTS